MAFNAFHQIFPAVHLSGTERCCYFLVPFWLGKAMGLVLDNELGVKLMCAAYWLDRSAIVFSYISLTYFNLEKFPQILFIFYDTGAFKRILHPFLSFNTTVSYFGIAQSFLMIKIRLHFPRWNRRDVCVLLRVLLLDIHSVHLPLIGDVNFDYWVKVLLTLSLYSYYFFSCNY